ncbi:Crp/Fnr family transcriptional regulator [uncultured Clostridium sp.]|uniref:Crp/Fnr family transcriptional regulator n=1 Tax=uncultured Clostridium sp. TaxID=59620 RepID=UPI0028EC1DCE|nr:Crp/Fnr family transcriptional regulator [uncultured Clostridium sp.]
MNDYLEHFSDDSLLPWFDYNDIDSALKNYLHLGVKKYSKKGTYIVKQGETIDKIHYLHKGKVKIVLLTASGQEKTFWYALGGNIVGCVPYYHNLPSNAGMIAVEDCELFSFDKKTFSEILLKEPSIYEEMLTIVSKKIRILVNTIQDISFLNPTARVCKLLYLMAQHYGVQCHDGITLKLNISHYEIASITSLHRVTVTKILNYLRQENIISKSRSNSIIIIDLNNLYKNAFEL